MSGGAGIGTDLRRRVTGRVLLPGDGPEYDAARRVWNAAADHHPAAVVRPADEDDVQAAVRFASEHALPVSMRSGGHHHAGYAAGEGALMIDLSSWRRVRVDAAAGTVTVQPGATWGELDAATTAHGLVTTGCDMPSVGVGGSVLGGGFGWLHRRFGLSCDNLLGARLVSADAAIRAVDARDADGLFWALRGGGGAFGVVTDLTLALHRVPALATTSALLPVEQARDGLAAYREITTNAPEELFVRALLMPAPPAPWVPVSLHGHPVLIVAGTWLGDPAGREGGL
ncbi:MAG: FAD-binding oxidoreductase, partial [Actinobacteria bacterium]|nr:FAD-binding oxidoreductase [Actinomycetota bacterium]